jgi:hypothetical protein
VNEDPLFASAHAALTFAFNYAPEQYAPSTMANLIKGGTLGSGKGLVGMDGAGQAGMILCEVARLGDRRDEKAFTGESHPYFLAARFAPHNMPCSCRNPCCVGYKPTNAFTEAMFWITHAAVEQLHDTSVNYRLRRGLVLRFYGERQNMSELAKFAGVHRDSASQHNAKLLPWLRQEDGAAMHAAIYRLKEIGMVR